MAAHIIVVNPYPPMFDACPRVVRVERVEGAAERSLVSELEPGQSAVARVWPGAGISITLAPPGDADPVGQPAAAQG